MITDEILTGRDEKLPYVAWVIVNYHNDAETIRFIKEEYLRGQNERIVLIVVNNGSKMRELDSVIAQLPGVKIVNPGSNLGYMGAFVYAMESFKTEYRSFPTVGVLSNTDINIPQINFAELLSKLKFEDNVAALGPQIIRADSGQHQNPLYKQRPSKIKLQLLRLLFSVYVFYLGYQFLYYLKNKLINRKIEGAESEMVFAIHGSFMIFNGSFINDCFNELGKAPFLFGEELFVAEICRKKGLKTKMLPGLEIIHNEHSLTGVYKSKKMVGYLVDSIKFILSEFY